MQFNNNNKAFKIVTLLSIILLIVCVVLTVALFKNKKNNSIIEPDLIITGDIKETKKVSNWKSLKNKQKAKTADGSFRAVPLSDILKTVEPIGTLKSIYFISQDGFTSQISTQDAQECFLSYSPKTGWAVVAPKHPISANAKELKQIVLVGDLKEEQKSLTIVSSNGDKQGFGLGELLIGNLVSFPKLEGNAVVGDKKQYTSYIYTRKVGYTIKDLVNVNPKDYLLLKSADGSENFIPNNGFIAIENGKINYYDQKGVSYNEIKNITICPYVDLAK